ncbi:MAG: hypothetical protein WCI11_19985 [Candidatus Methylumidiphilus sp.]
MKTPDVDAGRLERRVSLVGRETMRGVLGFGSLLTPILSGNKKTLPDLPGCILVKSRLSVL